MTRTRRRAAVVIAGLLLATMPLGVARAERNPNPGVALPPQARPFGTTLGGWLSDWLTWSLEIPASQNTVFNPNTCDVNQRGQVFFLPTSISLGMRYHCTVPAGAHVLACPGLTVGFLGLDANTEEQLRELVVEGLKPIEVVRMSVDGEPLEALLARYTVISPQLFTVDLPEDAIFGLPEGPRGVLGGGVCVMLHPLSVGEHTVRMFDAVGTDFKASSVSTITVVPRRPIVG